MKSSQLVQVLGKRLLVAGVLCVALMGMAGCPSGTGGTGQPTPNQEPVANAGADQTVTSGAQVTLTGTGTDPDGDTLTFAWAQTGGTAVTLTGANTATATFTSPATAGTLSFQLTVNDGRGGTSSDSVNVTVGAPTTVARLFIANFVGNNITSYANPGSINGNIAPDTNLSGANTQLASPADIVVGASGALLVSNFDGGTPSVTTYANGNTASGNVTPSGNVQGGNTQLTGGPTSLAVNTTSDLLFVSKLGAAPAILTFASVSTAGFTGNMAPARTITTTGVLTTPFGINLDKNGTLYVANNATATILVYANAANLNGNIAPTRTITGNPAFTGLFDVYVDAADRMYVVNSIGARINVYNNASTLNGAVAPDFTLTVQGGGTLTSIAVDSAGRGYITEEAPLPGRVLSYDNIATRNGTLVPDRIITGTNTQLNAPIRVFLEE